MSNWESSQSAHREDIRTDIIGIALIVFMLAFIFGFTLSCIEVYIFATEEGANEGTIRWAFLTFITYIAFFCILISWFIIKWRWRRHDISRMSPEDVQDIPAFNEDNIIKRLSDNN